MHSKLMHSKLIVIQFLLSWEDPLCFAILKELEIFYRPSITQEYLSFFGSFTCFGVTVKLFMSKSYYETSEMESAVRTLGARYSAPRYISLE